MSSVIVVGGGAAGMMAAYAAAKNGHQVTLFEQNEKLGKKIYITGKGRCNITNASDIDTLFSNVMSNRKFLYSAFYSFDNEQTVAFFEKYGVRTKVERGNRVFPVSDHSSDVIAALKRALEEESVDIRLRTKVESSMCAEYSLQEERSAGQKLLSWQPVDCLIRQPVQRETATGWRKRAAMSLSHRPRLWFLLKQRKRG